MPGWPRSGLRRIWKSSRGWWVVCGRFCLFAFFWGGYWFGGGWDFVLVAGFGVRKYYSRASCSMSCGGRGKERVEVWLA